MYKPGDVDIDIPAVGLFKLDLLTYHSLYLHP